jgi:hypothetical protein
MSGKRKGTNGVTESGVKDLDPDLVGLRKVDGDVFDRNGLTSGPGDGSLAGDDLFRAAGGRGEREKCEVWRR